MSHPPAPTWDARPSPAPTSAKVIGGDRHGDRGGDRRARQQPRTPDSTVVGCRPRQQATPCTTGRARGTALLAVAVETAPLSWGKLGAPIDRRSAPPFLPDGTPTTWRAERDVRKRARGGCRTHRQQPERHDLMAPWQAVAGPQSADFDPPLFPGRLPPPSVTGVPGTVPSRRSFATRTAARTPRGSPRSGAERGRAPSPGVCDHPSLRFRLCTWRRAGTQSLRPLVSPS
jgi:hypothetical protein